MAEERHLHGPAAMQSRSAGRQAVPVCRAAAEDAGRYRLAGAPGGHGAIMTTTADRVTVVQPDTVHDTTAFAYSQATRMDNLIFVAGQVALDREGKLVGKGDIYAQVTQV